MQGMQAIAGNSLYVMGSVVVQPLLRAHSAHRFDIVRGDAILILVSTRFASFGFFSFSWWYTYRLADSAF